jgi:translocation and assembly module TamB
MMNRKIKKAFKWTAFAVLLISLLTALVFSWIQTEAGRRQVASLFGKMLSSGAETRVEIHGLTGLFPFRFQVAEIEVSDSRGPWLIARDIAARWLPRDLLGGYVRFESLKAKTLDLTRLPEAAGPSKETSAWPPPWLRVLTTFRVENLHLERVTVSQALYGEAATLTVDGWLKSHPDLQEASLTVEGAKLTLKAYGALQNRMLTLDALFEEPAGGLIAHAAGMSGPLSLELKGIGKLPKWKGRLQALAGSAGRMEADIGIEDLKVSAKGKIHLDPKGTLFPLASLLGTEHAFLFAARWAKPETLAFDRIYFDGKDMTLDMKGSLDFAKGDAEGQFSFQCRNLESMDKALNMKARGRLNAEGRLHGRMDQPEMFSHFRIEDGGMEMVNFSIMEGDVLVAFPGKSHSAGTGLRVLGNGHVKDLEARGLHEKDIAWEVAFERPFEDVIRIKHLRLRGEKVAMDASGEWKPDQGTFSSLLEVNVKLPVPVPSLGPLIGKEARCSARMNLEKGGLLTFSDVHAETAGASLEGSGSLGLGLESLDASWLLTLPRLNLFNSTVGYPLEGSLRVQGLTRGSIKNLSSTLEARAKDLQVKGHPVEAGQLSLLIHGLPPKMSGDLTLFMKYKGLAWQTKADVTMENLTLAFPRFSIQGPQTHFDGDLVVHMDRAEVRGKINGLSRDLSIFSLWTHEEMAGSAEIGARLQMTPDSEELDLELAGKEVSTRFGQARQLRLQGRISGLTKGPHGSLEVKLEGANRDELKLAKSMIRIEGDRNQVQFFTTGEGRFREPFVAQATGFFSLPKESFRCDRFDGTYGRVPLSLISPLVIEKSQEGFGLNSFALKVGDGLVKGRGLWHKSSVDLSLQIENIPLEKLPFPSASNFAGTASGKIRLYGNLDNPEGTAEVRVSGIEVKEPRFERLPKAALVLNAQLHDRRLNSHLSVEGLTLSPFRTNLDLPLNLSLSPFAFSVPPGGAVAGDAQGEINLERIPSLLSLVDQTLKGQMMVGLKLEGSVEDARITGFIRVGKGTYENLRTGTLLTDLDLDISADPPRLIIERARATDGEKGTLTGEGWLDLRPSQGYPFRLEVSLDRASLLRSDNAVASGTGKLTLTGSYDHALLAGRIVVDPADFRIPKQLPPAITEVEVKEINKPETHAPPPVTNGKGEWPPIKLDVSASSPGRIHLEGRGLVSEWKGLVQVRGSTAHPVITGTLSLVRGQVDFLGKQFDLVRGTISFNGSSPPSPVLDVLAQAKTKDITATVNLLGPVTSPKIQLSSDPPLPSDEILSRLLFGRSAKNISPIQAVQLANALNTMSGGGGVDLLGRMRRLIGVDALTMNQSGDNYGQSTVSVGKYLSEGVYVEVEKGLSPETGKASLKWDVTPNITVGTDVGVNAQAGVSVDWRWDY